MLTCSKCGTTFRFEDGNFKFCPLCGNPLHQEVARFKPLDSTEISNEDKIKAFDEIYETALYLYDRAEYDIEKFGGYTSSDSEANMCLEDVVNLLKTGQDVDNQTIWDEMMREIKIYGEEN